MVTGFGRGGRFGFAAGVRHPEAAITRAARKKKTARCQPHRNIVILFAAFMSFLYDSALIARILPATSGKRKWFMRIRLLGGIDTVTGSQHLIECNGSRVLRDCGLFQGKRNEAREINGSFAFKADEVNSMLLSHVHMDHAGNIPRLVASGYKGPIHATSATVALTGIMLRDGGRIQEQDAAYLNQKNNRRGLEPIEPLYTVADVERALPQLVSHDYGQTLELAPGISMEALEAGHILGAALTRFTLTSDGRTARVGYALDLGRRNLPLVRDPEVMGEVEVLVIESTYGDTIHGDASSAADQLCDAVNAAFEKGGRVLIPSFALERAQELLYHLAILISSGRLPKRPVYVDSPMASAITRVFDEQTKYFDEEFRKLHAPAGFLMSPEWLRFVSSVEESKAVTTSSESCIVIAGSGMCEHGRILHHLKHGIGNPANTILIVGFQAQHTLGRRLVDGDKEVRIFGDMFKREAEVKILNAFSAHADRNELVDYVRRVKPRRVFLVHGEQRQREALAEALRTERLGDVYLPVRGDVIDL